MAKPVLVVGYKDSDEGRGALEQALDLAIAMDADVHVVHVVDLDDFPVDPDSGDWERQGRAELDRIRDQVLDRAAQAPMKVTYAAVPGDPAGVLHEAAAERAAVMIVVGVHPEASSPLSRLFSRPVSHAITRHLACPVLLVPHRP